MKTIVLNPDFPRLEEFFESLPGRFARGEGELLHRGRNEIRRLSYRGCDYVVKSFCRPHLLNRLVYGTLRGSKACRSYRHALAFLRIGVGTPTPVGYMDVRRGLLLDRSYYVSLLSPCPFTYADLYGADPCSGDAVLLEIGRLTAVIHRHGFLHRDYSRGNILFGPGPGGSVRIEIVDLNRMSTGRRVGLRRGCKNFERLPATPRMRQLMALGYARARGFDPVVCERLMALYRRRQPERIPGIDLFG